MKAVQSFRWEGQSSHACYAAGTGCAQSVGEGAGFVLVDSFWRRVVCQKIRKFECTLGRPVIMRRAEGQGEAARPVQR